VQPAGKMVYGVSLSPQPRFGWLSVEGGPCIDALVKRLVLRWQTTDETMGMLSRRWRWR
jgi:hypothetical protein